jgi:peptide/nickel transport system substrate-binding protein
VKKLLAISLVFVFALAAAGIAQEVKNPDTLVYMDYGTINTLDPAYAYDTASGGVMFQVYECLFKWPVGVVDADDRDLSYSLAIADLEPMLGTVVPSEDNGLIVILPDGKVLYTVPIREGVTFHNGNALTAEDVEYSFERAILQDRDGGPVWMFIEPFSGQDFWRLYQVVEDVLGIDTNRGETIPDLTPEQQAQVYAAIDGWVEVSSDGRSVLFTLDAPYPPFLSIIAHGGSWSSILDKEWCAEVGNWDGQPDTWAAHYNPGGGQAAEESSLYDVANGTGPYKLVVWDPGIEVVYEAYDDYWRAPAAVKNVVNRKVSEWTDRLLAFQNGDADIVSVDPQYVPQVEGLPGVVIHFDLPTLGLNPAGFFTSDLVMEGNDLVGDGQLGETGIPGIFFNDVHARRAFAYSFDDATYIEDVLGRVGGYDTIGPVPKAFGWAYDDDPALAYEFDLEMAKAEFQLAHGGAVWENGFTMTLLYNEGNDARKVQCEILELGIESLNPKFHIDVRGVPWATYLDMMIGGQMPFFVIGWLADFPDPHNFVVPFATSSGTFSGWQGDSLVAMFADRYDPLVTAAMATADQDERAALYYQIQERSYEDCYDLWLPQTNGYRVVQGWIQGWAFNPQFPDPYFYSIVKTNTEDY